MTTTNPSIRFKSLQPYLNAKHHAALQGALVDAQGDHAAAVDKLPEVPAKELKRLKLANALADLVDDHEPALTRLLADPKITSLRDVALSFNRQKLAELVDPNQLAAGDTPPDNTKAEKAARMNRHLFAAEPTAVVRRMLKTAELHIEDKGVEAGVKAFFEQQPDFDIRKTSVRAALSAPESLKGTPPEQHAAVTRQLETLQRLQAISPEPEALQTLMKAKYHSAFQVADVPREQFIKAHADELGEPTARALHDNAVNQRMRNEQALMTLREAVRGTGLAIIDGARTPEERLSLLKATVAQEKIPLNLETLFGSLDYCDCAECLSVHSPAAYFVDLLQYLRNNNLDPKSPNTGDAGFAGSPLEKLFRRRPDLGCLQLTCENTFTVLPYVDLANEVMESFVVRQGAYHEDGHDPKQATIDAHDVLDETTGELLAEAQNTNYQAYCTLKNAVFPFTLPYHQPLDATRTFLAYLEASRFELVDTYRTAHPECTPSSLSPEQKATLQALHERVLQRAADAEYLGLSQEEYIILTKEAFWPKQYFELTQGVTLTDEVYRKNIGVRDPWQYYGYEHEADMVSTDEQAKLGLTFVRGQFLRRTGIDYTDLVELVKTRFVNPLMPQGRALAVMQRIRSSYRFLASLVDSSATEPRLRFKKVLEVLESQLVAGQQQPESTDYHCGECVDKRPHDSCQDKEELRRWVYCHFERIGKLVVLDSGEGMLLPVWGKLFQYAGEMGAAEVGELFRDGRIVLKGDPKEYRVQVEPGSSIGGPIAGVVVPPLPDGWYEVRDENGNDTPYAIDQGRLVLFQNDHTTDVHWQPTQDTCNVESVRLIHLDGTAVVASEYDRMQRLLRLWRKLGWSIDEVDQALTGLGGPDSPEADQSSEGPGEAPCHALGFDAFQDDCAAVAAGGGGCGDDSESDGEGDDDCPPVDAVAAEISSAFVHQLPAVKKLLELTGLTLPKVLAFWAPISTSGERSLYRQLFLTHNLRALDPVFEGDTNGNYLTKPTKITEHIPVLMAALKLKADDIPALMAVLQLPDALTLQSVSALYRHSLLLKVLRIKVAELPKLYALLGDPFATAQATRQLLETWGKLEDAGFTLKQLAFIVLDQDDSLSPLAPDLRRTLLLTKTLYDGLVAIDAQHPDLPADPSAATSALVRAKAGLVFDAATVDAIAGLLDGTAVSTTNAPVGLSIVVPDALKARFSYTNNPNTVPPSAGVQLTGILSEGQRSALKALSSDAGWAKAIDRLGKRPGRVFDDTLFGVFQDGVVEAKAVLLGPDANDPADPDAATNTAPTKRRYFLTAFLPLLRRQLAERLIVDTVSGSIGLDAPVTRALLTQVLTGGAGSGESALEALEQLHAAPPAPPTAGWGGYLVPAADDAYVFVMTSEQAPAAMFLAGQAVAFPHQQEDPSNLWMSEPVSLRAGTLYALQVPGPVGALQWKTATAPRAPIPSSALLPDHSSTAVAPILRRLTKVALLLTGFQLDREQTLYLQSHGGDFGGLDLNAFTFAHWRRLQAYAELRDALPQRETRLIDLFGWCAAPDDAAKLVDHVVAATGWEAAKVVALIAPAHFDLGAPSHFRNEVALTKLRRAMDLERKLAIDVDRLFVWAAPGSKFWAMHRIAEDIRKAIHARFDQTDWEKVVKPLSDALRVHQKAALIDYLAVQPDLVEWGVVDADSLFEFFLIDVQMDACMETSRIKQAISSVQLFIQRALLGLEAPDVPSDALDRQRWEWMQRYRVWEANRKVFLYPENWLVPELRDDKSPIFKELESELLQKDLNPQTIEDGLKNYLFKLDEIAHLFVVGLYHEQVDATPERLHVVARSRNAPYLFYYRYFDYGEENWYPWERLQVDIPSYELEQNGQVTKHGTLVAPVVVDGRLLVFFPQIVKKTSTSQTLRNVGDADHPSWRPATLQEVGDAPFGGGQNSEYNEIKIGWTERRNGKWLQKQLSKDVAYDSDTTEAVIDVYKLVRTMAPAVDKYQLVPRLTGQFGEVKVDVYRDTLRSVFTFQRSQVVSVSGGSAAKLAQSTSFHYLSTGRLFSLQATAATTPDFTSPPHFQEVSDRVQVVTDWGSGDTFTHVYADALVANATSTEAVFEYYSKAALSSFGQDDYPYDELKDPYGLYNWEADFHAPMLLVDRLLKSQQYEQALAMCHNVLNPFATVTSPKQFWQFPPFREVNAERVLERLFASLQPRASDPDITEWREKPFQPHVVARRRPAAYMKWVAVKYIEILIAWGDSLFRQDTIESINQATQLYVLASHVFGPKSYKIPKRGKVQPQSYYSLLDKWDAFSNAMVELELAFPFSNQPEVPEGATDDPAAGLTNIFGSASALYFCIPDNPSLRALRATIDDRLFKIRHCENIEGVFRKLPLFEPPIDPALLVQAAAQGISVASVLNDLSRPLPNYRFYFLLQKALEMCGELKALGSLFLSAKEKGDAEAMARLRSTHELAMANLVMEVRKQQLDEAEKALEGLKQSRQGPASRMRYYLALVDEDLSNVPAEDAEFRELTNKIEAPIDEGGLKLIGFEKEEMDKAHAAADWQVGIGVVETLASIFHAIPLASAHATPVGLGLAVSWGGSNLGNATSAVGRGLRIYADRLSFQSSSAARKAGFLRQLQDRIQQANTAGYEIKSIDKQILAQQIRIAIAKQELENQQKQIDNSQEMDDFLHSKYTNQELHSWMEGQLREVYYQAYTLAYELAKRAEATYRFERGLSSSDFIRAGSWDAGRDGLLSGERLHLALKQLEAAYQERRGHDFEVSKSTSLRQIAPLALLELREKGSCEFWIPEALFDMDFPGHYQRRIKSMALSIPCVVGPYVGVNCTVRLLEHKYRVSAVAKDKSDYLEKIDQDEADDRFQTVNVPIGAMAASSAQNDSGVFELSFHDERYLPFEGAGAVSKWRLQLPSEFRQFDYDTINDVIVTLRYTSLDGGDKLRRAAVAALQESIKGTEEYSRDVGLFSAFDLVHDFSSEWYRSGAVANGTRSLELRDLKDLLPIFTQGRPASKIRAQDVLLFSDVALAASTTKLTASGATSTFADAPAVGALKAYGVKGLDAPVDTWRLTFVPPTTPIQKLWLVVRYTLV